MDRRGFGFLIARGDRLNSHCVLEGWGIEQELSALQPHIDHLRYADLSAPSPQIPHVPLMGADKNLEKTLEGLYAMFKCKNTGDQHFIMQAHVRFNSLAEKESTSAFKASASKLTVGILQQNASYPHVRLLSQPSTLVHARHL
ncbi:hypothetical protein CVT26_005698 [Gymnopilus dilepis]|uniref:Uncharacterized protein n=1 Tax=Gymnopilus dilepis TaxID=231916 RepID=A0A409YSF1_9AGAR|nr:hypothetical protein CVT26_005698 [Gymnopilus dilepis]